MHCKLIFTFFFAAPTRCTVFRTKMMSDRNTITEDGGAPLAEWANKCNPNGYSDDASADAIWDAEVGRPAAVNKETSWGN